jgi:iron(III) transport system ATP-binding protein
VDVAIRADDVTLERNGASRSLLLARHFQGAQNVYRVRLPSGRLIHSLQPHTLTLPAGTFVHIRPDAGHTLACYHEGNLVPLLD